VDDPIHITSEIGRLKTVLLHRPGEELEHLTPEHLQRLLFDDIPYLKVAQEEHDRFAELLRSRGVEVLYLDELAAEALADEAVRRQFVVKDIGRGLEVSTINTSSVKKIEEIIESFFF